MMDRKMLQFARRRKAVQIYSSYSRFQKSLEAKNIQLFSIHIQFMDFFSFFLKAGMNIISACLLHIPLACAKAVKASIHY